MKALESFVQIRYILVLMKALESFVHEVHVNPGVKSLSLFLDIYQQWYNFICFYIGALLKTAFICGNIIQLESNQSLSEQLQDKYGGGFEIHSWSNLPLGSGIVIQLFDLVSCALD